MSTIRERLGLSNNKVVKQNNQNSTYQYNNDISGIRGRLGLSNFNSTQNIQQNSTFNNNISLPTSLEDREKVLRQAENNARETYKNRLEEETGLSIMPKSFKSAKDLKSDIASKGSERNLKPLSTKDKAKMLEKGKKELEIKKEFHNSEEGQQLYENYRNLHNARVLNDYEMRNNKVQNDKIDFWDKNIVSGFLSGAGSLFTGSSSPIYKMVNADKDLIGENGESTYLPSKNDLKTQRVLEESNGAEKFLYQTSNSVGKIAASQAINALAGGVPIGSALYYSDMFLGAVDNAKQQGYSGDSAINYGLASTAMEFVTGKLLGTATKGLTNGNILELDDAITNKLMNKGLNQTLSKFLGNAGSEATEEFIQEYLDNINKLVFLDKSTDAKDYLDVLTDKDIAAEAFYSAAIGGVSGGFLGSLNSNQNVYDIYRNQLNELKKNTNNQETIKKVDKVLNQIKKVKYSTTQNEKIEDSINKIQNYKQDDVINSNIPTVEDIVKRPTSPFKYEKTDNQKINNLRESASKYFDNTERTQNLINTYEKIIQDKNYNVVFDDSIANQNGQLINGQIKNLKNGEVEIRVNPNSPRAGEFIIMHELTHAIETKSMIDLVLNYASNHTDFNEALKSLQKTYGTNDVSSEVLTDISGQLFGNQEFINSLSLEQPSIFRRIYNSIISLANKITGNSSEALFLKDLENKWREAYRTQYNNLNGAEYSIGGITAINSLENSKYKKDALNAYNRALQMEKTGNYSNEDIRKETNWFKDKNGDWKFEFDDSSITLNFNLINRNGSYKLEDIINHSLLFKLYPELKNYVVEFKDMQSLGSFNSKYKKIYINNEFLTSIGYKNLKGTLLHEIQHAIQHKENFETGKSSKISKKSYYNSLGEIEANDTKERYIKDFSKDDRKNIAPESSKKNPKHSQYDDYMSSRTNIDKMKDLLYPFIERGNKNGKTNQEINLKNRGRDNLLVDGRGLLENNSSFSFDENAKRYEDLKITDNIEFFKKDDGNIRVSMLDSNSNLVNQFDIYSKQDSIKQLGENIGNYIYAHASKDFNKINIGNDINNLGSETDYFMNHRPSETGITADNLINQNVESPMPLDIYEHPEYYSGIGNQALSETMQALNKARNKPDAKVIIYRATTGDKINKGDWVTLSRKYAEQHNQSNLNGKGNIVSLEVKAKDVQFAGDDLNEFGYFPNDNTKNSTSNQDKWKEYLDNYYQPSGTRTDMNDIKFPTPKEVNKANFPTVENSQATNKMLNPNEISQLTMEDANTTPILPTINRNKMNDGDSHFAKNIQNKTDMLNKEQKSKILNNKEVQYYDKVTNQESLDKAFKRLNDGGMSEVLNFQKRFSRDENGNIKSQATSTDVAEGWILLKQYADNKDYDSMIEIAKTMRDIGTQAGQTVQAFNIMARMTPEGMVKYAQSELIEAYNKMVKNKTQEWIDKYRNDFDLKPNEVQFIMDTMKEVSTMEDGYDKRVKLAGIQKLMTDKLPPEKGAGIKSWMRISMLFNPKTQVRNVAGNAIIMPVNSFGDLFASYADKLIAKKTGVRTTGKTNVKAILKGMKEGAYQATNDYRKGINTRDMEGNRFEITEGKSFNDKTLMGKSLNRVEGLLNYVMDAGDRVFSQGAFENSLQNQMILNNTTEITQDMLDIARTESLQRTWNDNNSYTKFVLDVRRMMNKIHIPGTESYGLGDVLIPFAKTPANLTKAIVDYSPAGLLKTIVEGNNLRKSLSNGQFNVQMQHQFVQDLGKAMAGSMLYILGVGLATAGITNGDSDDDKDVSNFIKNTLGISSYSIKVGNKSFTYDWAQPLAAPLSITANIVNSKNNKEQALLEGIIGSLDTGGSILLEQSFLQSINDVLSDNDGVVSGLINEMLELPARAVPTFSKQIADMVDSTQRTTFEYGKPIETALNSIKAKIPGLSKTLAPTVDTMGREIQKYGGKANIFNVFLNPANVNTENISKSAEEIYRLYKETGDTTIMPRVAPYYINQNGEKITMTSVERSEYQKISGQIVESSIKGLLKQSKYKNMSDSEKAEIINKLINYSYNKAKEDVLSIPMSNQYKKIQQYINDGGEAQDYYLNKEEIDYSYDNPGKYSTIRQITTYDNYLSYQKEIDSIKDNFDNTVQKKNGVISYVNSLKMSIPQKAMLIKLNYSSFNNYNNQIINYINNQNLTIDEKTQILTKLGFTIRNGRVYSK